MAQKSAANGMSFAQACQYLELSTDELAQLRLSGLVVPTSVGSKQVYRQIMLDIAKHLLRLGRERGWSYNTLAWYADLVFATQIGRAILLPIEAETTQIESLHTNWLQTHYATAVLADLRSDIEVNDGSFVVLLRSLIAIGEGTFWPDLEALQHSAVYPIIERLEVGNIPILDQRQAIARDAGPIALSALYAFTVIASPISDELGLLVSGTKARLKTRPETPKAKAEEEGQINREKLVAVDKVYASKATEIHSPLDTWNQNLNVLRIEKQTIALQMKLPIEPTDIFIDNIIDLIRPFLGPYGARVVHLMYEIANDPPYWRTPLVTVETNDLLDRLGLRRDERGIHYSRNRERLRDALNAAHNLEIIGEQTVWETGKPVVRAFRRTVLSLVGATFDPNERGDLSTVELFERGLPKTMQIRLNFYEGVRRLDSQLGSQYVLMPRLADPQKLPKANHAATSELLRSFLLFRYRQTNMESRMLTIHRKTALEKAHITTKNTTWATRTLTNALEKLVEEGVLESFNLPPIRKQQMLEVTLSMQIAEAISHQASDPLPE